MIRRKLCFSLCLSTTLVATTSVIFSAQRQQSGLHTFIRDAQTSTFSSASRGEDNGSASTSADWATRMQKELFGETDPLGGQAHKDYFRDSARGYSPQYAPRNFADGAAISYHHPQSVVEHIEASHRRSWLDHDVARMKESFSEQRALLRGMESPTERDGLTHMYADKHHIADTIVDNQSLNLIDQIHHSTCSSAGANRRQMIVDRYRLAEQQSPLALSDGIDSKTLKDAYTMNLESARDDFVDENLRIVHGLREKEKYDFTVLQRTARIPFRGYDMDRFLAQQKGTPYGAQQLPANISASTMEEAQRTLRGSGAATMPLFEAVSQKAFARNTVSDCPLIGEELTQEIVDTIRADKVTAAQQRDQKRAQRFGLGRQGALVQDGGPDKRILKKHTNDERVMDAMFFASDAYRKTPTDEHWNPYIRRDTRYGVGHLLNNKFDISRREDRLCKGEQDLTERSVMHFGVPIQQTIDEFVFRHRNARGERPLDYFKPFPSFRDLRLNRMYRDVEGFSLMKQRPEFLEWELFTRYRAHYEQRRQLALLHGLEPIANETVHERDLRRQKLDELCENTPFDDRILKPKDDELQVNGETLRSWFGMYMLPSPTIVKAVVGDSSSVNLHLYHLTDEMGTADTRENVLSSRYFNRLLLLESFQHRIGRGFVTSVTGKAPEPVIEYAQSPEVLRHFSTEERALYEQYVKEQTSQQLNKWSTTMRRRRWLPDHQQYGQVIAQGNEVLVVDLQHAETGLVMTVSVKEFEHEIDAARTNSRHIIMVEGQSYRLLQPISERVVVPVSVKLDSGDVLEMTNEMFECYELESLSSKISHALNYGIKDYAYNRGNYVETQDAIWEAQTASGEEGWSPATHADGLRSGLPVRARRNIGGCEKDGSPIVGAPQRAMIVEYKKQPFFNPEPRVVRVVFQVDGAVEDVLLSNVFIWQRRYHGPERTVGDESRRYSPVSLRRYIDVSDPLNEKTSNTPHFLDKYEVGRTAEEAKRKYRATKQITEIDDWTRFDSCRADNFRPLSISHRRDYIRLGYMHRFTPWEWIVVQEADQPLIAEQIRQDNIGPSYYFSPNRFWRYKARPHGYIRHFDNEVRDFLQFVDGVTPWKKAQKIRTYWEVRSHHPMPQFNRPEVAMHRNTVGLLPAHLWETDKKTGKVKAVKDSVRDYQTRTPLPKWVQL